MCGTSQDGLDLADVSFTFDPASGWSYDLHYGHTYSLPETLLTQIKSAKRASAFELAKLDVSFGKFCGEIVRSYLRETHSKASFIGSHGITIFHQPNIGLTTQIGSGATIASYSGLQTVSDFRQQDVCKGGQGAPLVPSCDQHLFPTYSHTVNLGGFANVSVLRPGLKGFDTGPCNLLLNHLARERGMLYDEGGQLARSGNLNSTFLEALNALTYYHGAPASLGSEYVQFEVFPAMARFSTLDLADRLCTVNHHIAQQISRHLKDASSVLVTGGGAHNAFLRELLKEKIAAKITLPDASLIDSKEAICFAFLGLRRILHQVNIYSVSTGSSADSSAGAVYLP